MAKFMLAEETLLFIERCYMSLFMGKITAEIVYDDRNETLPGHCKIDNITLHEIVKTIKRIIDIRLWVEMSIVREMIEKRK